MSSCAEADAVAAHIRIEQWCRAISVTTARLIVSSTLNCRQQLKWTCIKISHYQQKHQQSSNRLEKTCHRIPHTHHHRYYQCTAFSQTQHRRIGTEIRFPERPSITAITKSYQNITTLPNSFHSMKLCKSHRSCTTEQKTHFSVKKKMAFQMWYELDSTITENFTQTHRQSKQSQNN